ncbi:zinc finger and BTB domain-containing protein 42 [Dipodomys spectabilis]|uniref:zinc finger and BTB domain-containing protein 42 n=1 Tax=Dipodomys spectabilis TaxID=105255 RepID=UPI001C5455F1|nr:zinc finger and BTB domain-containing protein 42 [Dipodomys spectabilis]
MEFPGHGRRLLARLRRQRALGLLCDCTVLVGAARFPAHRAVLAACSVYFHLFYRHRPGRRTVRLDGHIVTAPAFGRLLDFMYEGRLDLRSLPLEDVLAAASYLHMYDVVRVCKGRLREDARGPPPAPPGRPAAPCPAARKAELPPAGVRTALALRASGPPPRQSPGESSGALDLSLKPGPRPEPGNRPRPGPEPGPQPCVRSRGQPGAPPPMKEEPDSTSEREDNGTPRGPPVCVPAARAADAQSLPVCEAGNQQLGLDAEPAAGVEEVGPRGHLCICPLCCKLFPSAHALQLHLSAHFRERDGARARPAPDGTVPTCPLCSKTFSCTYTLKRHERTHSGEKPYTCVQCGKAFQYSHNLSRHAVVHTREKPHACRWCERRFTQSGDLYRHVRKFHYGLVKSLLL